MKKEISYVCPHCEEKQDKICQWQNASVGYDFDLETQEFEQRDIEDYEHECWACPSCGQTLDTSKLPKQVREAISDYPQ